MTVLKSTGLPQFQDPLLNGFARIRILQHSGNSDRGFIMKIAKAILKARTHPKPANIFSKSGDPVLESVLELMTRERYHFTWKKLVVLGCSAGGNVALRSLFKHLIVPHLPIIIAIHHNPGFQFMRHFEMANSTLQRVITAKDGEQITGSRIFFIPGEAETGFSPRTTSFKIQPINYKTRFRPDINDIFKAVGIRFRENSIGVILSGMLDDGAEGIKAMALNRGEVCVQEPSTALFKEMPNAAIKSFAGVRVRSLQKIADRINQLTKDHLVIEPIRKHELYKSF